MQLENFHLASDLSFEEADSIIIFPGLNLSYTAFFEIAEILKEKLQSNILLFKHDPKRSLYEEEKIIEDFLISSTKEFPQKKFYIIGHSYGSLIAINSLQFSHSIEKTILICPALATRGTVSFFEKLIAKLPRNLPIISLNFSGYGILNSLEAARYNELLSIRYKALKNLNQLNEKSSIVLSKYDKAVNSTAVKKLLERLPCVTLEISERGKSLTFNHLPIDSKNLSSTGFQTLTEHISEFFSPLKR